MHHRHIGRVFEIGGAHNGDGHGATWWHPEHEREGRSGDDAAPTRTRTLAYDTASVIKHLYPHADLHHDERVIPGNWDEDAAEMGHTSVDIHNGDRVVSGH